MSTEAQEMEGREALEGNTVSPEVQCEEQARPGGGQAWGPNLACSI